jgi:hypothetical protein
MARHLKRDAFIVHIVPSSKPNYRTKFGYVTFEVFTAVTAACIGC